MSNNNNEQKVDIVSKINSRLLEPVQVRNILAGSCTLSLGNNGSKENCKVFKGHQVLSMKVQDIIAIAPNTKLFTGSDGFGTNAYLYIEDAEIREYLGFRTVGEDGKVRDQKVLKDDAIQRMLNDNNEDRFKENIMNIFANNIPKIRLLEDVIRRTNFNDAKKIKYIENTLNINIRL